MKGPEPMTTTLDTIRTRRTTRERYAALTQAIREQYGDQPTPEDDWQQDQ